MYVKIYCIFDENGIPLYIGKTKQKLSIRESQHQRRLKIKISINEIDLVKESEWKFWESYWIEQFKNWGFDLLNKNQGGGGPEFHPKNVREKMSNTFRPGTSQKLKGKKRPDVSKRLRGSKLPKETCEKISKAKQGHECYNTERTEKIKTSNQKHYQPGSNRNKQISNTTKGRKNPYITLTRSIPIIQRDKKRNFIREWNSATLAAQSLNKSPSAISECCSGKRKSAYNYIWEYKKEYLNLSHER
jgi:hypothetical protein